MLTQFVSYLDAGTGSLVVQTVIAGVLTAGFYLRTRFASIFKKSN
jgi:hypothetical protein